MGLPQQNPEGYEYASNLRLADRLKGKLMIAIGTSDTNATFGATMRMSDALIRAGKRFDLVVLPEQPHNLSGAALAYYYEARNRYLVEHLQP
jgi:dipeptidyl aminopeptidase/acylaminoacyl peptidase